MASYTTLQIDDIPSRFNSINKKIGGSINELVTSFDYDNLNELINEIKREYTELKNKIAEFTVELRINVLEIDDLKVFHKYKKYCGLRLNSIHKILEPQDVESQLNIDDNKYLHHTDLSKYSLFTVPAILDIYNLSGYLYTYSFMLVVLKKALVGIIDRLEFNNVLDEDLTMFDENKTGYEAISKFKLSNKRGMRTDLIRILHTFYELKFIENTDGQIPSKKDFMLKAGEFFGTDLSSYDSDLSQALNNITIEKNTEIFNKMIEAIKKSHFTSQNVNK